MALIQRMKRFNLTLKDINFINVLNKKKTLEGRLNKSKYKTIREGDHLFITNVDNVKDNRTLDLEVKKVYVFSTFEVALQTLDHKKAIPNKSLSKCLSIYYSFYPKDLTEKYGVVFFEVDLVKVHDRRLHKLKT